MIWRYPSRALPAYVKCTVVDVFCLQAFRLPRSQTCLRHPHACWHLPWHTSRPSSDSLVSTVSNKHCLEGCSSPSPMPMVCTAMSACSIKLTHRPFSLRFSLRWDWLQFETGVLGILSGAGWVLFLWGSVWFSFLWLQRLQICYSRPPTMTCISSPSRPHLFDSSVYARANFHFQIFNYFYFLDF